MKYNFFRGKIKSQRIWQCCGDLCSKCCKLVNIWQIAYKVTDFYFPQITILPAFFHYHVDQQLTSYPKFVFFISEHWTFFKVQQKTPDLMNLSHMKRTLNMYHPGKSPKVLNVLLYGNSFSRYIQLRCFQ